MKRHLMTMTVLFFLGCSVSYGQNNSAKTENEKAIRANVEQMVKGWNAKSGAEFAQPFAEDSDYVVINGMYIKGRADIAKGHQQIFDTFYKGFDIAVTVEQIRFLRHDVAIVHGLGERFPKTDRNQPTKSRITLVMFKKNGKWKIAAFQNTEIQTPGGK